MYLVCLQLVKIIMNEKDQIQEIVLLGTFNYPAFNTLDLLEKGARQSLKEKAGFSPQKSTLSKVEPFLDELALCNLEASKILQHLLKHKKRALLKEFFLLTNKKGLRIPSEFIPQLAEISVDFPELKPLILPVLGKWGSYVSEQNQDWKLWKIDNPKNWEKGNEVEQINYLQNKFKKEPFRALILLKERISSSSKAKQQLFFSQITNLQSIAYQEFIREQFEDKKSNLRLIALRYLAILGDAKVLTDLEAIFKTLFEIENSKISTKILLKKSLVWTLGFNKKSWIQDFCTCLPFGFWQAYFKITIEELLVFIANSEHSKSLFLGVLQNAIQSENYDLIFRIFKFSYSNLDFYNFIDEKTRKNILAKLKTNELEEIANRIFSNSSLGDFYFLMGEFVKYSKSWTETFAQKFLIYFEDKLQEAQTAIFLNKILLDLIHRLPLTLFRNLNIRWQELAHRFPSLAWQIERALHEFRIRQELQKIVLI